MNRVQYLAVCLLVGAAGLYGQAGPKGDAAKGREFFDQQCGLCHDATTTEKKMGPGLKGLFKRPKLTATGKPTNDANVLDKIMNGGNGMTPFKDMGLSAGDVANLMAYLKTL